MERDAVVGSGDKKVFEQKGVEFPDFWSENAVSIAVSKYFRGKLGTPQRETSLKQMITRVSLQVREWGIKFGHFGNEEEAKAFQDELDYVLLRQLGSFNSPVWFNVGTRPDPQCSACFILSVEDSMTSILEWIRTEGMIFKGGSGSGINLSSLRSKDESLSAGGRASGPVSFMRGADSVAGMIKSGGTTRRAAKMVILDVDHPDVMEFIRCKMEEEKKVRALIDAGYNMADLNNEAWNSIQFQNANNSVRFSDEFMRAAEEDREWTTKYRVSGEPAKTYRARDILRAVAEAAWACGDPGVQYDTVINSWHTCPNSGRINGSNPCSEYMHLDDSACNLASINLLHFLAPDGTFKVKEFRHTVRLFITAQEILVDGSSYPTEKIARNAHRFRQLGLGFANLGALLMAKGLAYDSEEGRALAASVSALMSGEAYRTSAEVAARIGPFEGYLENREPMLKVIAKHRAASYRISAGFLDDEVLLQAAQKSWDEAEQAGRKHGYRNSQVSVIAPTGTIAFIMDCDTTGIEPDFSLVKMKQLVGGGWMKIVNRTIPAALTRLGYEEAEVADIVSWIGEHGTVENAPHLKAEHLPIFDCAVKSKEGTRVIPWQGHVRMVAAVQPFISGAISKTFNMNSDTSVEEIAEAYRMAWHMGIKAFAVYRDGSKATQPLQTEAQKGDAKKLTAASRRRLPATHLSETHKFSVAGHDGYITYSAYEDGSVAELFVRIAKQGSTLSGLLDAFAIGISLALQYGVPLKVLARKFIHSRFEPAGFTENPDIRVATSILDYIFRYLALRFLPVEDLAEFGMHPATSVPVDTAHELAAHSVVAETKTATEAIAEKKVMVADTVCRKCGGMMVRTGTCQTCLSCGTSSGGCS